MIVFIPIFFNFFTSRLELGQRRRRERSWREWERTVGYAMTLRWNIIFKDLPIHQTWSIKFTFMGIKKTWNEEYNHFMISIIILIAISTSYIVAIIIRVSSDVSNLLETL